MAEALPILSIRSVTKRFDLQGRSIEALRAANLDIRKGEFVCIIGASGCGKSTLLRIVAGFEAATTGEIRMWDKPVAGPDPRRGMVFQDYGLFPWLTVRGNIAFGPRSRGRPRGESRALVERYIDMVGLGRFADAFPHQLSGGMKQRVAIARVLANDAEVVLMDEPFGALDAMSRDRLQGELLDLWLRTGLTVLFVTHSIEEAVLLADRIVVMSPSPGRIDAMHEVALARPRDVADPAFNDIRRQVAVQLHGAMPNAA